MAKLFSKAKAAEKETLTKVLSFIVAGTQSDAGYANAPDAMVKRIEKLEPGLIQPRSGATVDPAGNIAVFATSKGVAAVGGEEASEAPAQATEAKPQFVLETGFVVPETKRGGIKADIYPFAQMAVGQSFFIPATDARPNPAKALASTCSSATKRFASTYPAGHAKAGQPTGKDGRKFVVRNRTAGQDGEKANGARIYRVA